MSAGRVPLSHGRCGAGVCSSSGSWSGSSGPGRSSTGCGRPPWAVAGGAGGDRRDDVVLRRALVAGLGAVGPGAGAGPDGVRRLLPLAADQRDRARRRRRRRGPGSSARLARRGLGAGARPGGAGGPGRRAAAAGRLALGRPGCGGRRGTGRWRRAAPLDPGRGRAPGGLPRRRRVRGRRALTAPAAADRRAGAARLRHPAERRRLGSARGRGGLGVHGVRLDGRGRADRLCHVRGAGHGGHAARARWFSGGDDG